MIRNCINTLVLIALLLAPAVLLSVYAPPADETPTIRYEAVATDTMHGHPTGGR